jgi:hypothetical protein
MTPATTWQGPVRCTWPSVDPAARDKGIRDKESTMNAIIRKRVLALFSAVGLVGSTASVKAQAVQGDEANKTKTEGKIKLTKNKQETAAPSQDTNHKNIRTNADAASKDASKMHKAYAENGAAKDAAADKVHKTGQNAITVKQKSDIKSNKSTLESTHKVYSERIKGEGAAAHTNTLQTEGHIKGEKHAAETNAAQSQANQKAAQTTPK